MINKSQYSINKYNTKQKFHNIQKHIAKKILYKIKYNIDPPASRSPMALWKSGGRREEEREIEKERGRERDKQNIVKQRSQCV